MPWFTIAFIWLVLYFIWSWLGANKHVNLWHLPYITYCSSQMHHFQMHSMPLLMLFHLFFFCILFIVVWFANMWYNTQCSSHQVPPSVPITSLPQPPVHLPFHYPLFVSQSWESLMFCHPLWSLVLTARTMKRIATTLWFCLHRERCLGWVNHSPSTLNISLFNWLIIIEESFN